MAGARGPPARGDRGPVRVTGPPRVPRSPGRPSTGRSAGAAARAPRPATRRGARGSRSRRAGRSRSRDRRSAIGPAMRRSRVVLAMTDAAAMEALRWSPPTTARWGGACGPSRKPSTRQIDGQGSMRCQGARQQAQVRAVEPVPVDRRRARDEHDDLVGLAQDRLGDAVADVGGEALGVVEVAERAPAAGREPLEVEADRRDDQGPGEAAAAGLVGARHPADPELAVMGEQPRRGAAPVHPPPRRRHLRSRSAASRGSGPSCRPSRGGSRAWPG